MTKAAAKLKISQSTLSEQLAQLEDWLGQPLFDRRGRELHLTEAGRRHWNTRKLFSPPVTN